MFLEHVLTHPLPGERVVFYLRRHWIVFARQVAQYSLLAVAPVVLWYFTPTYLPTLWEFMWNGALMEAVVRMGASVYYLGLWVFFCNAWTDYYLDVWLVTNERVMSLEQRGLFNRRVSELRLSRVQDVAAHVKGFIHTTLDFGEVHIQTAGEEPNFVFHQVSHPDEVAQKVLHLADDWRHSHGEPSAGHPATSP